MASYLWHPIEPLSEKDRQIDLAAMEPIYETWQASKKRLEQSSAENLKEFKAPQAPPSEAFVFEIGAWTPSYSLSVDRNKDRDGPYREHVGIELETSCVFPKKLSGRRLVFNIWGKHDCLLPPILQSNPDWVPNCVGLLVLPPTSGRFYTALPNDSLAVLTTCLAHGLYRYIILYGPPLKWSKSPCSSMQWERTFNPADF